MWRQVNMVAKFLDFNLFPQREGHCRTMEEIYGLLFCSWVQSYTARSYRSFSSFFSCDIWRTTACLASYAGVFKEARFSFLGWKTSSPKNPCVGGYGLLRSRNFATMETWRKNFSLHSRAGLVWTGTVHNATKKPLSRGTALLRFNNPGQKSPIWVSYPRNSLRGRKSYRGKCLRRLLFPFYSVFFSLHTSKLTIVSAICHPWYILTCARFVKNR